MRIRNSVLVALPCALLGACDGCSNPSQSRIDALRADVPTADATDVIVDAIEVDAPPLLIEPECEGVSPTCTTTPTTFFPVASGTFVTTMFQIGDTMYVASYDSALGQVTDARVTVLDLATGTPTGTLFDHRTVDLSKALGWIYAVEYATGTISRFRPGVAPIELITGRPSPIRATADADYFYWAENDPTNGTRVMRNALAGGSPEVVMPCAQPWQLRVDDVNVYCENWNHDIMVGPKTGTTTPAAILYSSYPLIGMVRCGSTIYATALGDRVVYTVPLPNGPGTATTSFAGQTPPRITGMSASADHLYITTYSGIYRVARADNTYTIIAPGNFEMDNVVYNGTLYFFGRDIGIRRCSD